jgi:hypothetical protein
LPSPHSIQTTRRDTVDFPKGLRRLQKLEHFTIV